MDLRQATRLFTAPADDAIGHDLQARIAAEQAMTATPRCGCRDLTGLDDELAVLSGRTETVDLLDRVRAKHGDDPADWMVRFQQAQRGGA